MAAPSDSTIAVTADYRHSLAHPPHNSSTPTIIASPTKSVVEAEVSAVGQVPAARDLFPITRSTSEVDTSSRIEPPYDHEPGSDQETASEGFSDTESDSIASSTAYLNSNRPGASQDDCLFLNKLPAEMRNDIYELIRYEAIKLYEEAAYEYWTESQFVVCIELMIEEGGGELTDQLERDLRSGNSANLRHKYVDRICFIEVKGRNDIYAHFDGFTYLHDREIWVRAEWRSRRDVYCWFQPNEREQWGLAIRKKDARAAIRKTGTKALHEQLASLVGLAAIEWYDPNYDTGYFY